MHRDIVADNPKIGMKFMYHRRDGLWFFKIVSISDEYIRYDYKYYKGGKARKSIELEELVHWCDRECRVGWASGSSNHIDRWKVFITSGSEGSDFPVIRVILVDNLSNPTWEV